MNEETPPPSARALLPCLLPLYTLKKIRDRNLLVLEPVNTLKQLNTEEVFPWKEYRLHGKPQSLTAFLDLFLLENGEYDENRAIRIMDSDAFVRIWKWRLEERVPEAFREGVFEVQLLSSENPRCRYYLSIHSSTVEQAIPCLEFLFGLNDSNFQELELSYNNPGYDEGEPPICPLTNRCLEKLLIQNENRFNTFNSMAFTPDQSRVLVISGTNIGFSDCSTPDGGVAFVDAARQHSSLTKLSLWDRLPFDDIHFVWCLHHLNLEYLMLAYLNLDDGQTCRAVVAAEINHLHLDDCEFEDEEAVQVLVDNVRAERGPKGLFLNGEPFDSSERLEDFMNALRGKTYLERLDLGSLDFGTGGGIQALVAALPENRGLTHLGLMYCTVDDSCRNNLMGAIVGHPSLRTLSFIYDEDDNESSIFERHDAIHALAGMLAKNEQVDSIQVEPSFDRDVCDVWNAVVHPRIEINSYRKQFRAIQKIQNHATRAAVTARALAHLHNIPSLQFMLMSQNEDIVSSYLVEALTCKDEDSFI
jgi:hypothetical protein